MKKIISSNYTPYIIILLLSIFICIPMFTMNLALNNEAILHMSRIFSIDEVIKDGIFPPIINYRFMNGFGYALNLFYGPITTYIPIILLNIFGSSGLALKIFTVLTLIASGFTMYHFTYTLTNRKYISLISAIIYITLPYKLSNIYSRNAVGEYSAFIFIPIVFESLYKLINNIDTKSLLLSVGIIGLVLSHTISTIYIALFSIIYLLLNTKKLKNLKIWKNIFINVLIALLVCSFYWIPLLEHTFFGNYAIYSKELMGTAGIDVYESALTIKDLFASELGNQGIRFSLGILTTLLSILTIFSFKKVNKSYKYKDTYIQFIILSILSIIMSTKLFPWKLMPDFLTIIQFAWRNLGFFSFFISLVCSINAIIFAEKILKKDILKDTFLFGILVCVSIFSFLGTSRNFRFDDISKEIDLDIDRKSSNRVSAYKINREYMPLKAFENLEYIMERENKTYIIKGEATIISEEKNKLKDIIILENVSKNTELELPYLFYLGYNATIEYEGTIQKLEITQSNNGLLKITMPKINKGTIKIEYKGTTLTKIGYLISLITILTLVIERFIKRNEKKDTKCNKN